MNSTDEDRGKNGWINEEKCCIEGIGGIKGKERETKLVMMNKERS